MSQKEYLYAPPRKSNGNPIIACIVEKTGDETRTSMRQSEIYVYSQQISIRDGYMVAPKYHWGSFKQGDWVLTVPIYAEGRDGQLKDEKELTEIVKIKQEEYDEHGIPQTEFYNGYVRILCVFVLCPDFILYRENRNSYGLNKKLLLLNIGQGFVNSNGKMYNRVRPGQIYIGVFEFRAKDNGACNFGHRSDMRDHTNHVMERDCMWELVEFAEAPTSAHKDKMNQWLQKVKQDAVEFDKYLKKRRACCRQSDQWPLLENPQRNESVADITPRKSNLSISDSLTAVSTLQMQPNNLSDEVSAEDSTVSQMTLHTTSEADETTPIFHNTRELEEYRSKVIVRTLCEGKNGEPVMRWKDIETSQVAPDVDILNFKFDSRHKIVEIPLLVVEPVEATPVPLPDRSRTFSESSIRTNALGQPLANSTPIPSPEPQRRTIETTENEDDTFEAEDEDEEFDPAYNPHLMNETSDTTMMCRDNNANPSRPNPFLRR